MKIAKILSSIFLAIIFGILTSPAGAAPDVDGSLSSDDGYNEGVYVNLDVVAPKKGTKFSDVGELWTYQDSKSGDLYVSFTQPISLVDNSYGRNASGWNKRKHTFNQLVNSDSARFTILDSDNNVLFDFSMDYLSRDRKSKSKYSSLGATGRNGKVYEGSLDSLLEWGTSLDYNFNELGYVLKRNSPTPAQADSKYSGWEYTVTYEFRIDGSLFDKNGYGGVLIPYLHDSPNKVGGNTVYCKIGGAIPEPATICILGLGSLCLLRIRRHRKTA